MVENFRTFNKIQEKNTENTANHQNGLKSQISLFNQMPVTYNNKNTFCLFEGKELFHQASKNFFENNNKKLTHPYASATSNKLLVKRSNPVDTDILIEKKQKSENSITSFDSTPVMTPLIHSLPSNSMQEYGSFSEINNQKEDVLYSFFVSDDNLEEELNENLSSIDKEDRDSGFNDFLSDDEYEEHEPSLIKDILKLKILKQSYKTKFEGLERKEKKN